MSREFVLEIGTEEIPASYLPPALDQIKELAAKELAGQRISCGEISAFATPRRIVLMIQKVDEAQEAQEREVMGPAVAVAYDDKGKPTKAAEGFAKGQGVPVGDLKKVKTDKGEYVAVVKKEASQPSLEILSQVIPKIITSLNFPKMQRWGYLNLRFPRPIRWLLCLLGDDVVKFDLEGIESGRLMYGHRFLAPGPFEIEAAGDYLKAVKKAKVVLDQEERKEIIRKGVADAAAEVNCVTVESDDLLEEVTYLVEYPVVLRGTYEEKYLSLPRDVLTTSMSSHQRYFSLTDKKGDLQPYFITVANTITEDENVVIKGNERVLRARLEDGMFFFAEDRKIPLKQRVEELKDVVYQEKLGTSYEKYERFGALAEYLTKQVSPGNMDEVKEVALLCKGDLVTQMVGEFAELQGVMGKEYALLEGVDAEVAQGIVDHYLPKHSGDKTPGTVGGAAVSIGDRLDTVCGCFGIGITPSGTADPYGLRRDALAIIAILMDRGWRVSLTDLMNQSLKLLKKKIDKDPKTTLAALREFFAGRLLHLFTGKGYRNDLVQAVLEDHWDDPVDAAARLDAMMGFSKKPDFADLMLSFKRVMNIIPDGFSGKPDMKKAGEDAEKKLLEAARKVEKEASVLIGEGKYTEALEALAKLKGPVDGFFDGVMVMDKDEAKKNNRLAILSSISTLFAQVADFRQVVTE